MSVLMIIFAVLTGSLVYVLVGLVGARHKIGFGWTFLLSALFTPLIGLICALISDPLPEGERKWGCLGTILAMFVLILIAVVFVLCLGVVL